MKITPFYKNIKDIDKAFASKKDNYVRIDFKTKDDQDLSIAVEFYPFCKWIKKYHQPEKDIYKDFIDYFVKHSQKVNKSDKLNEIVDDYGNIVPDEDMPNNANNRMIGTNFNYSMSKVYRQSIPRHGNMYSGDLGIGIITW